MEAAALASWLPWTITTTGKERVRTWKTSSLFPIENCDLKSIVNFSSVTDSAPLLSDLFMRFRDMLRKLT